MQQPTNSTLSQLPVDSVRFLLYRDTDILAIGGYLPVLLAVFSLRMRRKCYFRSSGKKFDFTIRFGVPDFLKEYQ